MRPAVRVLVCFVFIVFSVGGPVCWEGSGRTSRDSRRRETGRNGERELLRLQPRVQNGRRQGRYGSDYRQDRSGHSRPTPTHYVGNFRRERPHFPWFVSNVRFWGEIVRRGAADRSGTCNERRVRHIARGPWYRRDGDHVGEGFRRSGRQLRRALRLHTGSGVRRRREGGGGRDRFPRRFFVQGRAAQRVRFPFLFLAGRLFCVPRRFQYVLRVVGAWEGVFSILSHHGALRVFNKRCHRRVVREGVVRLSIAVHRHPRRDFAWCAVCALFLSNGASERVLLVETWGKGLIFFRDHTRRPHRFVV